jgi:hypothetical protein
MQSKALYSTTTARTDVDREGSSDERRSEDERPVTPTNQSRDTC